MVFGSIADIFFQWEYLGVFDFILPFLLVFVIVYGILSSTKFFGKNQGVYVIIAFVIGLMSLRYQYFMSSFLSELFPRLGVGLAVLLALLVLVGIFIGDKDNYWRYILMAVGFIIFIIVLWQSSESLGWYWMGNFGSDSVGFVLLIVLLIGAIVAVVTSSREKSGSSIIDIKWPRAP